MHLYHLLTKINIPPFNTEDECPRQQQQHHVTVINLLIMRAAVILAEQHRQMQCTMDWYFWGKTGKCPFTCCLFSSVIMQFCVTQIFAFIHEVVRVITVMAVDYPILCGPCTNINILLFSGNKKNVINCCLLFILDSA